jgi:hypothetical protein
MITAKQAEARRNNGKLSNGPNTPEGKAVSSRNAVKFGFFSRHPLLPGEDEHAFAAFRSGALTELGPEGFVENELAERIVSAAWRLRRVPAVEAGIIEWQMWAGLARTSRKQAVELTTWSSIDCTEAENPEECREYVEREAEAFAHMASPELALGRAFIRDAEEADTLGRLCRAEMLLSRVFYGSLHELRWLQESRQRRARQNEPTEGLTAELLAA